jgi:hypothetical protein
MRKYLIALVVALFSLPAFAKDVPSCDSIMLDVKAQVEAAGMQPLGAKKMPSGLILVWSDGKVTAALVFSDKPQKAPDPFKSLGPCKRPDGGPGFAYFAMAANPEA